MINASLISIKVKKKTENVNAKRATNSLTKEFHLFSVPFFSSIQIDRKIFRGCLSDSSEPRLLCERGDEFGKCVKCPSSGCNNQSKFRKPQLSCIKCSDSENCAFGYDPSAAEPCTQDVTFGDEESCFVHKIEGNFIYLKYKISNI